MPGNYQYASQHPHAPSSISGFVYTYDDNGNLTQDKDYTYTWDHYHRLTSATNRQTAETTQYTYDHTGQRLTEQTTEDVSVTPNQYIEITNDEVIKRIYAGSAHLATIKTDNETEQISYIHPDHLNGASVITDESGNMRQRIRYYPFGETLSQEGEATEDKLFTGHKRDDTGLYYANARYLNPVTGQFTSIDPASRANPEQFLYDPQQLNSYSYVRNNPVLYIDPNGEILEKFFNYISNNSGNAATVIYGVGNNVSKVDQTPAVQLLLNQVSPIKGEARKILVGDPSDNINALGSAFSDISTVTNEQQDLSDRLFAGAKLGLLLGTRGRSRIFNKGLKNLPRVISAQKKLNNLSKQLNKEPNQILESITKNGKKFIDNKNNGNINIFSPKFEGSGFLRATLDPKQERIISIGQVRAKQIINGIKKGRFSPIK